MYEKFGEIIKAKREGLNWDQAELARRLSSVTQQTVSRWERGISRPRRNEVSKIAALLRIDIGELLDAAGHAKATSDGSAKGKPVRPLLPHLPLHELSPELFEQFTADLAQREFPEATVNRYGSQGHKQYGIDVEVVHPRGKPTGIQCKREKEFGPAKILKAVKALKLDVRECRINLARVASPDARLEIKKHRKWRLVDVADISQAVRRLPIETAMRLVDTYFPGWREPFLGVSAPGPWLTRDQFFLPMSGDRIYSHDWQLIGRDSELRELLSLMIEGSSGLVVLIGRGGLGKTRLLRELATQLESAHSNVVRFLAQGVVIQPADFEVLPPANGLLVVIDDAHDRTDLATLVEGIGRFRPGAKILLSARPYGQSQAAADLRRVGLHPADFPSVELGDLRAADAEALARTALGSTANDLVARHLAHTGVDCPLLIVVGAALFKRGLLTGKALQASDKIRDEILHAFEKALAGNPTTGDPELRREVLKGIAAVQPVRANDPKVQATLAGLTGKPYDQLIPHLRSLEDAGVLLRRGDSLRIVPDLLGDSILARAAIDEHSGGVTGYVERALRIADGAALQHMFINASRVDWQVRQRVTGAVSVADAVWDVVIREFQSAGTRGRTTILSLLKKVAFFQPAQTLSLVRWAMDHPTAHMEQVDDPLARLYPPSSDDVLRGLPPLLGNVAYSFDHLPDAANLLWHLAKDDTRPTNQYPEHPIRILRELADFELGKPIAYNDAMVDIARKWLEDPASSAWACSPFDVLEPLLATEGHDHQSDGWTITFRPYAVNADVVRGIRERVIALALEEARSTDPRRAVRAIQAIEEAIRYPAGMFGRPVSAQERNRWTLAFQETISRLGDVIADPELDPVVAVAARRALHWHLYYSSSTTRAAAQQALDRIPASPERELALALHDGWGQLRKDVDDYQEMQRRMQEWFQQVADTVIAEWPDDLSLVDVLTKRLDIDGQALVGNAGHPGPLMWILISTKSSVGELICQRLLQGPDSPVLQVLNVALACLAETEPDKAVALASELVEAGDIRVVRQVASSFGRGPRATLANGELALLKALAASSDEFVRQCAALAARRIANSNHSKAVELVTSIRFMDSKEVAGEVLSAFGRNEFLSWNDLRDSEAEDILLQLRDCRTIDEHHIMEFLSNLSKTNPRVVLRLLMDRVERSERVAAAIDYDPLPFAWHTTFHFRDSAEFAALLAEVRDWLADDPGSWRWQRNGASIFQLVATDFDEQVLQVLEDGLRSNSHKMTRAIGTILQVVPRTFVWDNVEFVRRALNLAARHGEDLAQAVGGGLYSAVTTGSRSGIPGQPFPEDVEQRDRSKEVVSSLVPGSIERRFYETLIESSERSIKWSLERDADVGERRDW